MLRLLAFVNSGEIFAPFNVEVSRISGKGSFDASSGGNTTVFIGAIATDVNPRTGVKFATAFTPDIFSDYPHLSRAHLLQARSRDIDKGAFELGLETVLTGLAARRTAAEG